MEYYAAKKEGTPTFCNSIHRTRDYYAKGNEPVGEGQIPHDLESNEQNKLMSKTEPETWKQGTGRQMPEERGEGERWKEGEGISQTYE